MKFKVKTDVLVKGLQKVTGIIGSKTTLPILANVLIEGSENRIRMTTTDLQIRLSTSIEAEIEEPGATTVPAKRLFNLISKFKGDTVAFDINENHQAHITCGTADFMLIGLNPETEDFPKFNGFEAVRKLKMKQTDFARLIDRISYAVSIDDSRQVLHGILFSVCEGTVTMVATDGKRLALCEKVLEEPAEGNDGDIIMTLKAASEARRVLQKEGDVQIMIGESQAHFQIGDTDVIFKLIEGTYPPYRNVIPKEFSKKVDIKCRDFIDALEIVSIPLFDTSSYVKLTFAENKLTFEANNINVGEGRESMDISYADESVSVSFNPQFLLDPFKRLDVENVVLKMNDAFNPIELESSDGFLYIIMPMRKN